MVYLDVKHLPTRMSKKTCFLLMGLVVGFYIIDNLSLFSFLDFWIYSNIIKPIYWFVIIFVILKLPRIKPKSKLKFLDSIYFWAILFAVIYVVIWFAAGFIDGFGKSPYDLAPVGILINILVFGTMLVGQELIRSHLVRNLTKKENYFIFLLITIFFTVISFSFKKYTTLKDLKEAVKFFAEFFVPMFSKNLMATYLAYVGGTISSLCYLGIIGIVAYISPILPNLKWITTSLIGIMCPIFSMMTMQSIYLKFTKAINKTNEKKENPIEWLIISILSIGIIWFAAGVFPIYPSVIATGSMEPMIKPGDIILVDKIGSNKIVVGEVIQFKRENILISHRVIEVLGDDKSVLYRTKGDNNSTADSQLVKPEEVKGKIIYVIPKIGWPTLLLKQEHDIPIDELEF